ncbi:MAG: nuclear transport factor 2 family protein [Acidobacteriia bacterium]|nr:nuclear transport factor 2 family protein [Terriglobia bacterium]
MRVMMAFCAILVATSLLPAAQERPTALADETKIIALENAWNYAEEHKDARALDELLSSTLVYVDYDGSMMDKTQFLASVRVPSLHPEQIVNDKMTVHMYGSTAVVTGLYREKGISKGKPYIRRGRFTDTWVFEDGAWRCVASQSTLISQ